MGTVPTLEDCRHILTHLPAIKPKNDTHHQTQAFSSFPFLPPFFIRHNTCVLGMVFGLPEHRTRNQGETIEMDKIWAQLRAGAEKLVDECVAQRLTGTFDGCAEGEVGGKSKLWVSSLDDEPTRIYHRRKIEMSRERLGQMAGGALQTDLPPVTNDNMQFGAGFYSL